MDKPKEKKHIHLNAEEKRHVAQLIANGSTYREVNAWHMMRFGKLMTMSKFYNHKNKHKKTLENKSKTNTYTRKGEADLLFSAVHYRDPTTVGSCDIRKSNQELEITGDYIQQELNEKLETALVLSEN